MGLMGGRGRSCQVDARRRGNRRRGNEGEIGALLGGAPLLAPLAAEGLVERAALVTPHLQGKLVEAAPTNEIGKTRTT